MINTVTVVVARGRSVMTASGQHGPGAILEFDLADADAKHLLATGFVKLFEAETPKAPGTIRVHEVSPDDTGNLFQSPSWYEQREAAAAEKAANIAGEVA